MPVCITGMHRSGTSMVTKILHTSGLYLGAEADLIPPKPHNPEGFWENRRFIDINASLLKKLRGAWDCPPVAPSDWTDDGFAPNRREAELLLASFAGQEPWGWKDPRNCLTLPFWQSLVRELRVVVVVRSPLEVALSLRKRNGFSYALGLSLWQAYNERLMEAVPPSDRIVTHYDSYFRKPDAELRRLLQYVGLEVSSDAIEAVHTVHVAELRHHEVTALDRRAADLAPEISHLYSQLCDEANWQETSPDQTDDGVVDPDLVKRWDDSEPERGSRLDTKPAKNDRAQRRRDLKAAESRIAELEEMLETQRQALSKYESAAREATA